MSPVEQLIALIPTGKQNAISRGELAERMQLSDRHMRVVLAEARHEGAMILNDMDGKGYYFPSEDDIDDMLRFYKQNRARAISIFKSISAVRDTLIKLGVNYL